MSCLSGYMSCLSGLPFFPFYFLHAQLVCYAHVYVFPCMHVCICMNQQIVHTVYLLCIAVEPGGGIHALP